jgi:sugar lactone lactonase YvrE
MVLSRSIFNGLCALALLLAGCGGGGSSTPTYSLGGTVVGLSAGQQVLLLSGAGTQVTLSSNGNFRFPDRLPKGSKYNLVVQQQPSGQTCVISNGSDTAGVAADVSNVTVVCSDNPAVLGGTVSGLPSGTSVSLSTTIGSAGAASVASISANGPYSLAQRPASGAAYAVTITTQPQGASCAVSNGSGTAGASAITNIDVVCSPARMNIGGELLGLAQGQQVQLSLAGTGIAQGLAALTLSSNGSFSFLSLTPGIAYGGDFTVTIAAQPTSQTCALSRASGVGVIANVNQVQVNCLTNRHTLGGSATGLVAPAGGRPLVLRNGADSVTISANGPFQFPTALADGVGYSVTIGSQPTGQTCTVSNDSGNTVSAPVGNVLAQCLSFVWRSRLVAGSGVAGTVDDLAGMARFSAPSGLAITPRGDVVVADFSSSRIRSVSMPLGYVSTLAGSPVPGLTDHAVAQLASFRAPTGVAIDSNGNVFVADSGNHVIRRISASTGAVSTWAGSGVAGYANGIGTAAQFNGPRALAIDTAGNLYVADTGNHVIRKISPTGTVTLLAGSPGVRGRADGASATFNGPEGVAVSPQGIVYVADTQNHLVRSLSLSGVVATVAGSGSPGAQDGTGAKAGFSLPTGLAVDTQAMLYVADAGNHAIRQIQLLGAVGTVLTIAGTGRSAYSEGVGTAVGFDQPTAVALDAAGQLLITEGGGNRLRSLFRSPN